MLDGLLNVALGETGMNLEESGGIGLVVVTANCWLIYRYGRDDYRVVECL